MTQVNLNALFAGYNILNHLKKKFNFGSKSPITISDAMSTIRSFEIFNKRVTEVSNSEVRYAIHLSGSVTNFSKECLDTLSDFGTATDGDEEQYLEEKVRAYLLELFQKAEDCLLGLVGLISGEMMADGTYDAIPDQLKSFTQLGVVKFKEQRERERYEDEAVDIIDASGQEDITREAIKEVVEDLTVKTLDELPEEDEEPAPKTEAKPRQIISTEIDKI